MDIFVIGLLVFNTLLLASLVHVHGFGFRLMSGELNSFERNVKASAGTYSDLIDKRFADIDQKLEALRLLVQPFGLQLQDSLSLMHLVKADVAGSLVGGQVESVLNQVHSTVAAFKNDLITQVRLSREDYEELMATAESKNADFPQQLNDLRLILTTLQTQLSDFRNKFDAFTE